jgi:hypothetical protein
MIVKFTEENIFKSVEAGCLREVENHLALNF